MAFEKQSDEDVGDAPPLQGTLSPRPTAAVADAVEGVIGGFVQEMVADDGGRQVSTQQALRLALLFLAICFSLWGYFIFISFFDCHSVCQEILERNLKANLQQHSAETKQ